MCCPTADKVIVSGVNTATKHAKARRANDKAGIIDRDMPIHVSNVMLVHKGKPVRVGYEVRDGKKVRVAKIAGGTTEVIDERHRTTAAPPPWPAPSPD